MDETKSWEQLCMDLCREQRRPIKPVIGTEFTDEGVFESKVRLGGTCIATSEGDTPEESEDDAWQAAYFVFLGANGTEKKADENGIEQPGTGSYTAAEPQKGPLRSTQPRNGPTYAEFKASVARVTPVQAPPDVKETSYKNELQELAQRHGMPIPRYESTATGESHSPHFSSHVTVANRRFDGVGTSPKKALAEQSAALEALKVLMPELENVAYEEEGKHGSKYKNLLQEYAQSMGYGQPEYEGTSKGLSHMISWWVDVRIPGVDALFSTYPDTYSTKKEAEFAAAKIAYEGLRNPMSIKNATSTPAPSKNPAQDVSPAVFHKDESRAEMLANAKHKLQDICYQAHLPLPVYDSRSFGSPHVPQWVTTVVIGQVRHSTTASFPSKKVSEQESALLALENLERYVREKRRGGARQENVQPLAVAHPPTHTSPPARPQAARPLIHLPVSLKGLETGPAVSQLGGDARTILRAAISNYAIEKGEDLEDGWVDRMALEDEQDWTDLLVEVLKACAKKIQAVRNKPT